MPATPNSLLAHGFSQLLKYPDGAAVQTVLCFEVETATFWRYAGGVWTAMNKDNIGMEVRKFIMNKEATSQLTMSKIRDVVDQLGAEVDRHDVLADEWVAFVDGSWHPDTDEFAPHSPERFSTIKVNALYNNLPKPEDGPVFHKFLSDICVKEDGSPSLGMMDLLQELAGYMLLASSERAVSFFLTGRGRNGKGVFGAILQEIIGRERVCNLSLEDLTGDRFATSDLIGKRLNVCDETNTHRDSASAMFKKLVSVDFIRGQRKYERGVNFKPRCKFLFLMNGIPTFDGFDYALRERIIPIPFFRSFSQDERDYTLKDKIIKKELPCVIAWAMEGLRRLQKNNLRFTMTEESLYTLNQFEDASSSLSEFFNQGWEPSDFPTPFSDFYEEFVEWLKKTGRKQMSSNRVSREMHDRVGKGRMVRHPISGDSVAGIMVKRRMKEKMKEADPFDILK